MSDDEGLGPARVQADFRRDYVTAAREFLRLADVRIPSSFSDEDISRAYWNTRLRWVEARPRRVHLATNLLVAAPNSEGLTQLKCKFEQAMDVNPHQSKAMGNAGHSAFHDLLFNDWGIQHFHLGELRPGQRFSERTGQLLYAIVETDDVYFIALLPHGASIELGLLETIHANWPSLLPRAVGVTGSQLSEEQRRILRRKRVNCAPRLADGTTYMPRGGGFMTSGANVNVQMMTDRCMDAAATYQRSVEEDAESIARQIKLGSGRDVGSPMKLRMVLEDGQAIVVEETAKVRFPLGPFPPPIRK